MNLNDWIVPGMTPWTAISRTISAGTIFTISARLSTKNVTPTTISMTAAVREPVDSAPSVMMPPQASQIMCRDRWYR